MTTAVRTAVGSVALAAATVLAWWAWLGRDTTYRVDANGVRTGPYTTAQVAACLLTIAVLLFLTVRLGVHPLAAVGAVSVAFTGAWTISAALGDDSGLFLVGGFLVLLGTLVGGALIAFLADLSRGRREEQS